MLRRTSLIGVTLVALGGTLIAGSAQALPQAPAASAVEVKYTGGVWRGQTGDSVEVAFVEAGRDQTVTGTVMRVDKYTVTVETDVAGKKARKSIPLGDVRKVTLKAAAAAPAGEQPASTTSGPAAAAGAASGTTPAAPAAAATAKKQVFILPLNGGVGDGLRHNEMDKLEKEMDKYGPGQIMIMRINSPGGAVVEADMIWDSLMRIKKKHRLVSWIEEAISGGAFTGLIADEVYFMDVGSLGAITMFAGDKSITGAALQAWLEKMNQLGEVGGRDGHVIQCMVYSPLLCSYDKDEKTGKVTWHKDLSGQYKLSDEKDNLVFNATNAFHSGFSQGTANTEEELFKAMQLQEGTYVVNDAGKRVGENWEKTLKTAQEEIPSLFQDLQVKGIGTGDAAARLGIQIGILKKLLAWHDRIDSEITASMVRLPPKDWIQDRIKLLSKELADLRKAQQEERKRG